MWSYNSFRFLWTYVIMAGLSNSFFKLFTSLSSRLLRSVYFNLKIAVTGLGAFGTGFKRFLLSKRSSILSSTGSSTLGNKALFWRNSGKQVAPRPFGTLKLIGGLVFSLFLNSCSSYSFYLRSFSAFATFIISSWFLFALMPPR